MQCRCCYLYENGCRMKCRIQTNEKRTSTYEIRMHMCHEERAFKRTLSRPNLSSNRMQSKNKKSQKIKNQKSNTNVREVNKILNYCEFLGERNRKFTQLSTFRNLFKVVTIYCGTTLLLCVCSCLYCDIFNGSNFKVLC